MFPLRRLALLLVPSLAIPLAALAAPAPGAPAWPVRSPRLSAAAERMLRDALSRGESLPAGWVGRFHLDEASEEPGPSSPGAKAGVSPALDDLAGDVLVNDRAPDAGSCSACAFRLLSQAETTIAADGLHLVAGWNNSRGFCAGGAVQGYGWSADGGLTWTDAGDPPALPSGGRYRGDPVHAVNRKSGKFYISGLYEGGSPGSGIAIARGSFGGGGFAIDLNRQVAVGGGAFLDKSWIAVDSLTGNVYVTWTTFDANDHVDFQRFDADLNPIGPVTQLSSPASNGNVQGSRPVVGSGGRLYVTWYEYGLPLSHLRIRRSDDFGATFGPERTIADFYENGYSGAPGYRRAFAPTFPSIAVDASGGPHDGRVYVAWDETVNFYDAPFPGVVATAERENDDFFASATAFAVGDMLYGATSSGSDTDVYSFTAAAGQTVVMRSDSASAGYSYALRIVCAGDTTGLNDWRILAYTSGAAPALCWTAPESGTYYLRVTSALAGSYKLNTTLDTPSAGERALGNRDQFVSWSDDGATWSTPVRVCDSASRFDGIFPEVAVDGLGRAHCFWHDFRTGAASCDAESYEVLTSSGDGGLTWGANLAVSDAASFWSFNACGSANQGDYQAITAEGASVYACWTDSRLGDPDVWTDASVRDHAAGCPPAVVTVAGADTTLALFVQNAGSSTETLAWDVTASTPGFVLGVSPAASGSQAIAPGGSLQLDVHVATWCGDALPAGLLTVTNPSIPGDERVCGFSAHCVNVGVEEGAAPALSFAAPRPNPSTGSVSFAFALPRAGRASLALYGANGRRVRLLARGEFAAGTHELVWDGRDDAGRHAAPGAYFARLEAAGRSLARTVLRVN